MSITTITKRKTKAVPKAKFKKHTIDLGNGVMFPVNDKGEEEFVKWAIEEAKAGRITLPKRAPGITKLPKNTDGIKRKDWWSDYEYVRSDRF